MKPFDIFETCQHVLVVAAHADDMETMCGGTLLRLREQGTQLSLLLATDGDLGLQQPSMSKPALAALRREEAQQAADALGLHALHFLGYHDGMLVDDLALRREVAHAYRRLQPDTIFTFDPLAGYRSNLHPDHLAIGRAAIDAFMPAKMPLYHPEQLGEGSALSRVEKIFCFATLEPDVVVPVDGVYEQKIQLGLLHRSQFPDGEENLEWMKQRDRAAAQQHAAEGVEFAELFRQIETY